MFRALLIALSVFFAVKGESKSADFSVRLGDGGYAIVMTGPIVVGDAKKLQSKFPKHAAVVEIFLASPGGDVEEALKMAALIDRSFVTVIAPQKHKETVGSNGVGKSESDSRCREHQIRVADCSCASACALIWIVAKTRADGDVLIHRPHFEQQSFSKMSNSEAIRAYTEMEKNLRQFLLASAIPNALVDKIFSVPSSSAKYLTKDEISTLPRNSGFEELMYSRCRTFFAGKDVSAYASMLDEEREKLQSEVARLRGAVSKEEKILKLDLEAKIDIVYEKIFAVAPFVFAYNECVKRELLRQQMQVQRVVPLTKEESTKVLEEALQSLIDEELLQKKSSGD